MCLSLARASVNPVKLIGKQLMECFLNDIL